MSTITMEKASLNTQTKTKMEYRRGDIVLIDFKGSVGSEQAGIRPAIIVQNDMGNLYSPCLTVAPVTSKLMKRVLPTHVLIPKHYSDFKEDSIVLVEQTSTVDKKRVIQHIGSLDARFMSQVDKSIMVQMGLSHLM